MRNEIHVAISRAENAVLLGTSGLILMSENHAATPIAELAAKIEAEIRQLAKEHGWEITI